MQMYRWWVGLACGVLLSVGVFAQPSVTDFPTLDALADAQIPPLEAAEIAQRLGAYDGTWQPPALVEVPLPQGTRERFWGSSDDSSFLFDAELVAVGQHIYVWLEVGQNVDTGNLAIFAKQFDARVYDAVRELWGTEASPGVDGDPRIHAVFARNLGSDVAAYYADRHSSPIEVIPTSNAREMMFFNLDAFSSSLNDPLLVTIAAHEFQHMIRANVDPNEDSWMDEGFSTFTEHYLGEPLSWTVFSFMSAPNTQLNTWSEDGSRAADYGAAQLWVTYLYERFGLGALQALSQDPANGLAAVDNLAPQYGTDTATLFADWTLANLLVDPTQTPEGIYGYRELDGLPSVRTQSVALPADWQGTVNQYAAQYLVLSDLEGVPALNITLDAPALAKLTPTDSPTNTPMWYSNRGDGSNMRLTLPLDLRGTSAPMLEAAVWYHIEDLWDYAYLMVSVDGGTRWQILETPLSVSDNPNQTAYGAGYTGKSGGGSSPSWVREYVSLEAFAGQEILLRFEMITDDAINQHGMLIDRISVRDGKNPPFYESDFSEPDAASAFIAEGWLLTDNRLPQAVWLQAIQHVGDRAQVTRWQTSGGSQTFQLPLDAKTQRVTLVLAPYAPLTTVPVALTLSVR